MQDSVKQYRACISRNAVITDCYTSEANYLDHDHGAFAKVKTLLSPLLPICLS